MNRKLQTALMSCAMLGVGLALAMPANSQTAPKAPAPKPAAAPGVRVAAGDVNGDGVALLVPAIQKVRGAANSAHASDALLKFEPIKGEAAKGGDDHREQIEIASWSLGAVDMAQCSGSAGAGTLTLSGASLNPAAANSDKPRIAVLESKQKADPLTDGLLIIRFEGLSAARSQPTEQVALNYSKVSWNRPTCKAAAKR